MSNSLAEQLRAIAAQLESTPGSPGESRAPAEPTGSAAVEYAKMVWQADGTLAADFWVKGLIGAQKGCHNKHWADAMLTAGMLGGPPKHLYIVTAVPADLPWFSSLASAADCGWIDGGQYNPMPQEGRLQRWYAAGCPSKNGNGVYGNDGSSINPQAWAAVWQGMANLRG